MDRPVHILLVEDEVVIAMGLKNELTQAGYKETDWVVSGEEALAIIKEDTPDIILMDIRLSDKMNGIETAKQILSFREIPIIFITGYSNDEMVDRAKQLNLAGYLTKPLNISHLLNLMKQLGF